MNIKQYYTIYFYYNKWTANYSGSQFSNNWQFRSISGSLKIKIYNYETEHCSDKKMSWKDSLKRMINTYLVDLGQLEGVPIKINI